MLHRNLSNARTLSSCFNVLALMVVAANLAFTQPAATREPTLIRTEGAETGAQPPTYKFTIIAKEGDVIGGQTIRFPDHAMMNNAGVIVFDASAEPGNVSHVYQTSRDTLGTAPVFIANGHTPVIDNLGTILFDCPAGLCTQFGVVANGGDSIGGATIRDFTSHSISENGRIVFTAELVPRNQPVGQLEDAQGLFTPGTLLLRSCDFATLPTLTSPPECDPNGAPGASVGGTELTGINSAVINNAGSIVFGCGLGLKHPAICTPSSILDQVGSTISDHTLTNVGAPGLNSAGSVVFEGQFDPTGNAIFSPSTALIQAGDTFGGYTLVGDRLISMTGPGSINEGGTIIFSAAAANAGGIFTQDGLVLNVGDVIDGLTITPLPRSAVISNNGDILMTVLYGQSPQLPAIVLAEPQCGASGNGCGGPRAEQRSNRRLIPRPRLTQSVAN